MAKIAKRVYRDGLPIDVADLVDRKIIAVAELPDTDAVIVGRYGTNKGALRKILKKEIDNV